MTLKGTDKQVAWANEIKAQKIEELQNEMNEALNQGADPEETKAMLDKCLAMLDEFDHASIWIEHKNYAVGDLLDSVASRILGKTVWSS